MSVPSTSTDIRPADQEPGRRLSAGDSKTLADRASARPTRILLVDDSEAVREGLRQMLELTGWAAVVGVAAEGEQAVREAVRLRPEVVVLDLEMPVLGGLEAAPRLKSLCPAPRLIALTVHSSEERRMTAAAAGFDAFVVKGAPLATLLDAITGACTAGAHDDDIYDSSSPARKETS